MAVRQQRARSEGCLWRETLQSRPSTAPGTWSEVGEPSTRIAKAGLFLFQRGAALGACDKEEARWRIAVNVATYPVLLWQQKAPVAKAAGA